jgi:hypothetical protein
MFQAPQTMAATPTLATQVVRLSPDAAFLLSSICRLVYFLLPASWVLYYRFFLRPAVQFRALTTDRGRGLFVIPSRSKQRVGNETPDRTSLRLLRHSGGYRGPDRMIRNWSHALLRPRSSVNSLFSCLSWGAQSLRPSAAGPHTASCSASVSKSSLRPGATRSACVGTVVRPPIFRVAPTRCLRASKDACLGP